MNKYYVTTIDWATYGNEQTFKKCDVLTLIYASSQRPGEFKITFNVDGGIDDVAR